MISRTGCHIPFREGGVPSEPISFGSDGASLSRSPSEGLQKCEFWRCSATNRRAFSLIELLVVITIVIIFLVLVVPSWNHISNSMSLSQAADRLSEGISLARWDAMTKGRESRILFSREDGKLSSFRVLEVLQLADGTWSTNALTRTIRLPDSVAISDSGSPILTLSGIGEGFVFRVNGRPYSLAGAPLTTNSYLTLQPKNFSGSTPKNFIILQVNPVTGQIQSYQP